MQENNNKRYIEGNHCVKFAIFAFLGLWIVAGLLLRPIAERKIEELNAIQQNAVAAVRELADIQMKYLIIPMSIFLTVQGLYLLRLGILTFRAGIHPPPLIRMPFRSRIQTGKKASLAAVGYIFAGICNFVVIALFLMMRHDMLKHVQQRF